MEKPVEPTSDDYDYYRSRDTLQARLLDVRDCFMCTRVHACKSRLFVHVTYSGLFGSPVFWGICLSGVVFTCVVNKEVALL